MDEKKELSALEKRYKRLRWAQWILFFLSIIVAALPAVIVARLVALRFESAKEGWSLAGFAVIILGIGALMIFRGLVRKLTDKIPWALGAAIGGWIMTVAFVSLRNIIDDALYISMALAIGCTVAVIMSSVSDLCKALADGIEDEYHRRQG